ncbi:MAG TPA: hypothetical protein VKF15_07310 [Nitrososphaerales archaeon]|nr:hypothetical protein [Nitrososphaerales archaeon]
MTNNVNEGPKRRSAKGPYSIMTILLLGLSILAVTFATSAGAAASMNLVDVTIQTTQNLPYQYTLTAYNTSGYQVANFYGSFPEAAFALPSGTYLITASAYYQQNYGCNYCPLAMKSGNGSAALMPIRYVPPYSEYGYAVEKLSGPAQITITTKNSTAAPLVNLPIHVTFANGTAAVGVDVYASVIGASYGYSPNWVTYGQTGSDGNFTLVVPEAPVQVSASISVPIQLPKNVSTVTVVVGGQKVNVTVYWQPNSVNLSGQTLVLPPQNGAAIILQVQQSNPFPIYYATSGVAHGGVSAPQGGVYSATTTYSATTAGGQQGASKQLVASPQANRIPAFSPSNSQLSPSGGQAAASPKAPAALFDLATVETLMAVVAAAAVIGVGVSLVLSRRKQGIESARL